MSVIRDDAISYEFVKFGKIDGMWKGLFLVKVPYIQSNFKWDLEPSDLLDEDNLDIGVEGIKKLTDSFAPEEKIGYVILINKSHLDSDDEKKVLDSFFSHVISHVTVASFYGLYQQQEATDGS